jgi:hypothetical protein
MTLPALPDKPNTLATVDWSLEGLLAVVLPSSRSTAFPAALALAQSASHYAQQTAGKLVYHLAGFGRSQGQAARALELLRLVRSLKGFQLFVRGALYADAWRVAKVLECYLQSCAAADPRAHCVMMVDERELYEGPPMSMAIHIHAHSRPAPPPGLQWVNDIGRLPFPCRYLKHYGFRLQRGHPSSEADQIQAAAVREGCDWCPNFNPGRSDQ